MKEADSNKQLLSNDCNEVLVLAKSENLVNLLQLLADKEILEKVKKEKEYEKLRESLTLLTLAWSEQSNGLIREENISAIIPEYLITWMEIHTHFDVLFNIYNLVLICW